MKIENIISHCKKKLINDQKKDGHWVYDLEADTTIPSEYILMNHFLGIKESSLEKKLGNQGRVLIRPSGTEELLRVMVEASSKDLAKDLANELSDFIRKAA